MSDQREPGHITGREPTYPVPVTHPLRAIRDNFDAPLTRTLSGLTWGPAESSEAVGLRQPIAPERLARAMLLQVLYGIRGDFQIVEHVAYNLIFRWFVGLHSNESMWSHSDFTQGRERLLRARPVANVIVEAVKSAVAQKLLDARFNVDITMVRSWVAGNEAPGFTLQDALRRASQWVDSLENTLSAVARNSLGGRE